MRLYDNSDYVSPSPNLELTDDNSVVLYESSPVDEFLYEEKTSATDDSVAIHLCCDIGILFNQQRLSRELAPAVADWFALNSSDLSDKYPNLTDDEILSCVKSRYVQRPSEIRQWTEYLMSELDSLALAKANDVPPAPESESNGVESSNE